MTCWSTPTTPAARRCPTCGRSTATPTRTTCGCGAWATRWTAPGRSGTRRPRTTARLATETARAMRQVDPRIELVACGSSHQRRCRPSAPGRPPCSSTPTTPSTTSALHGYYEERDGDLASFLASSVDMDELIRSVIATADHVGAQPRQPQAGRPLLRRVERLVPARLRRAHRPRPRAHAAAHRGHLLGRGRRRGRRLPQRLPPPRGPASRSPARPSSSTSSG